MTDFRLESLTKFLEQLAARSPAPGGGASAGVTVALAAAQAEMVVAWTKPELPEAIDHLRQVRAQAMDLAIRDAEAYRRWSELQKERPEGDPELQSATKDILQIPEALATLSLELLRECVRLAPKTNPRLGSDLGIAGQLAAAGVPSAAWNTKANLHLVHSEDRAGVQQIMAQQEREAQSLLAQLNDFLST
ncbi:MAG: cyclodeaminase/cyclohydrolase family protein [Planctomycetota bacterium]|nr:cyclodeaminase/cyclohydrolase family protein [Planctomycetota bacterium]